MTEMKKCPFCAEQIRLEAVKCRYCSSYLSGQRPLTAWTRQSEDRMLAGVCGGLAKHFDVPVTVMRLAFAIGAIFSGFGPAIILYVVLWAVMPLEEPLYDETFYEDDPDED